MSEEKEIEKHPLSDAYRMLMNETIKFMMAITGDDFFLAEAVARQVADRFQTITKINFIDNCNDKKIEE